ncbi:heavy-metal-associated domain-containing protein, partial [Ralstonia sp. ASV6]
MTTFSVEGMSCGHCVSAVTRAVQQVDAAASVQVDLSTQT